VSLLHDVPGGGGGVLLSSEYFLAHMCPVDDACGH
jgi:hypothetical protein